MAIRLALGVTPESLLSQATVVEGTVDDIAKQVGAMQRAIASTSYWKGSASDVHHKDMAANEKEIAVILQRLKKYPADIRQMSGIYSTAESSNKAKAQQLASSVPLR